MMRVRAFAIFAFTLVSADALAGGVPPSVVPVRQQFLPDGKPIYSFPVRIGGTIVVTGLDTGSIGLRVLPGTLRPGDARDTGQANSQTYGSNVVLDGTVGLARVSTGLADRSTPLQLVSTVSCKVKGCPYDRVMPPSAYRLEGDGYPDRGFRAIAGVRLNFDPPTPVPNLFAGLGVSRWLIDLPRRNERSTGVIVLDPPSALTRDFVTLPDARAAFGSSAIQPGQVPGCLVGNGVPLCGVVLFDSGAPGISVLTKDPVTPWGKSPTVTFQLTDGPAHNVLASESFVADASFETALHFGTYRPGDFDRPQIRVGVLPFLAFSVLYDARRPGLSIRARRPAPGGPVATAP